MRKLVIALFAVAVVFLLGVIGWYYVYTNQIQSELQQAEARADQRKEITVTFAVTPPANTPKNQILYLSGSVPALGNWEAAGIPLKTGPDGKHTAAVRLFTTADYTFKVTRGTWGTVETDANGKDIANRAIENLKDGQTIEVAVANWIDSGRTVPGRVTMTGDIRLHKKFHSDLLANERTLIVYLPPGYELANDRYPVLYMQDGQNLFDESTSYQGIEWKMDETLQRLIAENKLNPIIVVGIYNSEQRSAEYTPPSLSGKTPGTGDKYARFVMEEVKPFIDQRYRTMTDRAHTAIGGASMGGLIAMYTAKQYPAAFGQLVLMSPWLKLNDKPVLADWLGDGKWLAGDKIYLEMGSDPGDNYPSKSPLADAQQLAAALEKAGLKPNQDLLYREIDGGRHNESAWSNTIEQALLFLYGKPQAPPATMPVATP